VAQHVSGREVRAPLYSQGLYEFELTIDGLDSTGFGFPNLGNQSLQALMGLYIQCQGQYGTFLFVDSTDTVAIDQYYKSRRQSVPLNQPVWCRFESGAKVYRSC
jgi:hypothetical protein